MSISVVMTTYNGENKLLTQLTTLRDQTRKADEVLIFDDCSTDKSVAIIQNFIYENHLYEWTLIENADNKGARKNFAAGINTARGDLIFLCDQDDEWKPEKIETMASVLEERDEISLLVSDYDVRYEKNADRIRRLLSKQYGKERIEKAELNGLTFEPIRPRFTFAFKKEMISLVNSIRTEEDELERVLWDIALLRGSLYILNEKLVTHVRYADHMTKADHLLRNSRIEEVRYRRILAERLLNHLEGIENRAWLEEYIKVAQMREDAISRKSLKDLFALSKTKEYMPRSVSWMADLFSAFRS